MYAGSSQRFSREERQWRTHDSKNKQLTEDHPKGGQL